MVGLKSVWLLLISLFLFGACVPKAKQTECGSNEAFNSQLRSCVPIVQGPSAFINISSFAPLYTSTRYKNDPTPVTFTISVSNPYNQTYTIEWEHSYNGLPNNLAGNVLTTSAFIPSLNSSNIGSNLITAKIISGGNVVDSHNFEVVIQDSPVPNINTATITPADYYPLLYGDNTGQQFSFTGRNNGATSIGNYRTYWTLSQNGVPLPGSSETDTFTNTATNGSNIFYYGTAATPAFDASTLGLGSYVLRVRMESLTTPGTVVAEHQWNITVKDRDFGFVSSAGSPFTGQDTIAFFSLDYGTYPFANSIASQSNFCVTLSDPDGAYTNGSASDPTSKNMVVRFYKDGSGTPIYEGATSPIDDTVCFNDAGAAEKATLVYNDGSPTVPHYRSLSARAFDEQTGREICATGLPSCPVTYPIAWKVLVKPVDTGVVGVFQPIGGADNITYTTSGASVRSATVEQSDLVTVRFIPSDGVVGYEGYDMTNPVNAGFFSYDIIVKKAGVTVDTIPCKALAAVFPFTLSPEQACTFTWPGFNSTTNDHLDPGTYVAYLQVTDTGSPVPGSIGTVSNALTINATVSEPVNAPRFNPAPDILDPLNNIIVSANEGAPIKFRVRVEEDEHDDYTLNIDACGTDATCAPASLSAVGSDSRVYNDPLYLENTAITYTIPEDILGVTASNTIYFKVTLTDAPTTAAKSSSTTVTMSILVNNANPDIAFTGALVTPAVASTYDVFSGYTFTGQLNAALVDASSDTDERPKAYSWWVGTANNLNDPTVWTSIQGATTDILRWTPGPELSGTRFIAVCYSDGFPRTTASSATAPDLDGDLNQRCSSLWTITPKTNSVVGTTLAAATGEVAVHHVPAEGIAYIAYASTNAISVEKVEYLANGTLGKPMAVVSFNALSSGSSDSIKNLSLATSDTSLYVAYLADATGVPGVSFRAHIRRINISKDVSQGGDKTATIFAGTAGSKRKFDFDYLGFAVAPSCASAAGNCVYNAVARTVTFNGAAINTASADNITVNGQLIDFEQTSLKTSVEICSDCDANGQAQSFAAAINTNPSLLLQGLTATVAANVATFHGLEANASEIFASTQAMISAGKILYSPDTARWYWPVSNADLAGAQKKIQILHGPDTDLTAASMTTSNTFVALDDISALDNAWSTDVPLQMYIGYINFSGVGKVSKFQPAGNNFALVSTRSLTATSLSEIQLSPPLGAENPNVFVSSRDSSGASWISRLPAALTSEVSYKIELLGADAGQTTILTAANVSKVAVVPARPATAGGVTNEGRVVVVSNNGTADYQSYLFRWKTVGTSQILESTTTFDRNLEETSVNSKLAVSAPTSMTLGHGGAVAAGNINNTMGVIRFRDDGEVEFNFLNTEVESINSTTNAAGGEYRAPYVK